MPYEADAYTTREDAETALRAAQEAGATGAILLAIDPDASWLPAVEVSAAPLGWGVSSECGEWMLAPDEAIDDADPECPYAHPAGYGWYCVA